MLRNVAHARLERVLRRAVEQEVIDLLLDRRERDAHYSFGHAPSGEETPSPARDEPATRRDQAICMTSLMLAETLPVSAMRMGPSTFADREAPSPGGCTKRMLDRQRVPWCRAHGFARHVHDMDRVGRGAPCPGRQRTRRSSRAGTSATAVGQSPSPSALGCEESPVPGDSDHPARPVPASSPCSSLQENRRRAARGARRALREMLSVHPLGA